MDFFLVGKVPKTIRLKECCMLLVLKNSYNRKRWSFMGHFCYKFLSRGMMASLGSLEKMTSYVMINKNKCFLCFFCKQISNLSQKSFQQILREIVAMFVTEATQFCVTAGSTLLLLCKKHIWILFIR